MTRHWFAILTTSWAAVVASYVGDERVPVLAAVVWLALSLAVGRALGMPPGLIPTDDGRKKEGER